VHPSFDALIKGLAGAELVRGTNTAIGDIAHDSRDVKPGSCFVCRRGLRVDGHAYVPAALASGAAAIVAVGCVTAFLAGLSLRLKSWQSRWRLKRQRWKHYGALHHLWFFTPATLARVIEAAGFEVLHLETPVLERPGRRGWVSALIRLPLEAARAGGIVDLYARAR